MRNPPEALMLFAAGLGTRMAPLTDTRPKPLIPVAGRPLIDHALGLAHGAGTGRIVANTHYLAEQIESHLAGTGVTTVHEASEILDTGGGLKHALPQLGDGPVFTLNTDAIWTGPNPLRTLADAWDPDRMDALLILIPPATATGHLGPGDFTLAADGGLSRGKGYVYGGAQILKTGPVRAVTEPVFSLNRVWDTIAAQDRLFGVVHRGGWCDVGRPESISLAEALLAEAARV